MLVGFVVSWSAGMPIGFALALAALIYVWVEGSLPGVIFAQQMARGIDNFVLLAIPFFILVGYLMEANGMSVRLIALLRAAGRAHAGRPQRRHGARDGDLFRHFRLEDGGRGRGRLRADPGGAPVRQNPGNAVALLAASAVMAETIPPCINLIILGFVANLSIGGLFMAGLLPAGLMALALITVSIVFGTKAAEARRGHPGRVRRRGMWMGASSPSASSR